MEFQTVEWMGDCIKIIDQRRLPDEEVYLELRTPEDVYRAIKDMAIRGAPAIGVVAGYGVALASKRGEKEVREAISLLKRSRPTAYNLFYALDRMEKALNQKGISSLIDEAIAIHNEDREKCQKMGEYGAQLLPDNATCMTICNAGALATGGIGTALAVFYMAKEMGKKIRVFVPETRPFLQGSRLTAWELMKNGIETILIADNARAIVLEREGVDAVFVGADRIAGNGDTANKIGTLSLAIASNFFGVPFYVVAPITTFDPAIASGNGIPIEERASEEVTHIGGKRIAPVNIKVKNPVFDVTPAHLISGIITEKGILHPPYTVSIRKIL